MNLGNWKIAYMFMNIYNYLKYSYLIDLINLKSRKIYINIQ